MEENNNLTSQSYERKVALTLKNEKFLLPNLVKHKELLNNLDSNNINQVSFAYNYYKQKIESTDNNYTEEFLDIVVPIISEKGLNFDFENQDIQNCIKKYNNIVLKDIEKISILFNFTNSDEYNKDFINDGWCLSFDHIEDLPFLVGLGCSKIIIFDENYDLDIHFFASLGGMPDIRPVEKVGNIKLPNSSFIINLQLMVGSSFQSISILLLKQNIKNLNSFVGLMNNITLVVDTKTNIYDDFTGLKWIKNSLQYSLFKKKEFLSIAKILKINGFIIDKSVSPMQIKNISSLKSQIGNVNLDIGFNIIKFGTLQFSIIKKNKDIDLKYQSINEIICRSTGVNFSQY